MSTIRKIEMQCGLCGHTFSARILMSTNAFGSADLDLRPPQMKRATMPLWVHQCPNCGYVHEDIEENGNQHKALIKSKDYLLCEGANLKDALACKFYRYALILLNEGKQADAYEAFLHAAWASDDADDKKGAVFCRNKAIGLYSKKLFHNHLDEALRHVDLLRRTGRFAEAIRLCKTLPLKSDLTKKVAAFQIALSGNKDTACYRISDSDSYIRTQPSAARRRLRVVSIKTTTTDDKHTPTT